MNNLRITTRKLTDGSTVWQVRFKAIHADGTGSTRHRTSVSLEVYTRKDAAKLFDALNESCAYAETDPS